MEKYFKADKKGNLIACTKDELLASLVEQVVVPDAERKMLWEEVEGEIEISNIRKSSSDDAVWLVEIIDRLIDQLKLYEKKHPDNCTCIFCF